MHFDDENNNDISSTESQQQNSNQSDTLEPEDSVSVDVGDQELVACQRDAEMWKERYLRVSADLENMRRRMAKDHESSLISAQTALFSDLLAVVDNFDRALADQKSSEDISLKSWVDGIALVRKELATILSSYGVEEITEMDTFDPELHEALAQIDAPGKESGSIVDVLQKGYRFKGRILRHAKVAVAR